LINFACATCVLHLTRQDHVPDTCACDAVLFELAARRALNLTIQITTITNP
jgi:hypothetical protein